MHSRPYATCKELHRTLFRRRCDDPYRHGLVGSACSELAVYICVFTGMRVCNTCLGFENESRNRSYPLLPEEVRNLYGLESSHVQDLPAFYSIRGYYTRGRIHVSRRHQFIDSAVAEAKAIENHCSDAAVRFQETFSLLT